MNINECQTDYHHELRKEISRNFPNRSVEWKRIHNLYQADLIEMIPF